MKTVVVGMSGGVDSSVAAYLLKKQGYKVIGLFMKNWEDDECKSHIDHEDVVDIANHLGIDHYTINFKQEYRDQVFASFLADLKKGLTPNPDILCNREIKFDIFWKKAREIGADFLATGHYCNTKDGLLFRGKDRDKDQSYFLAGVKDGALKNVLFPIGELEKKEVRQIAKEMELSVHDKKDSTGICFIGKRNFKEFTSQYLGYSPGDFENLKGEKLGKHDGAAFYTIGQRKGLKIGGPGEAWFVVGKDLSRNVVMIEQGKDHPALYSDELTAHSLNWIGNEPKLPFTCTAKIRYRQKDETCRVTVQKNGELNVKFERPQRAITPGQLISFYDDERCLGGGWIK